MKRKEKIKAVLNKILEIGLITCASILMFFMIATIYGKMTGIGYIAFILPLALILTAIN